MSPLGSETDSSSLITKRKRTGGETNAMGNQVFFSHFDEKFDYIIAKFTSKAKQL